MKSQIHKKLAQPFRVTRADIFLILVPALLWVVATQARPWVIHPRCQTQPESCTHESVLSADQLSLGQENWKADQYSYWTQNLTGVLAVATPLIWSTSVPLFGGFAVPALFVSTLGTDLVLIAETVVWNGLFTEVSHLIAQRPRPFVYINPELRGSDPAHYTSFYSGHTSFVAAAGMAAFLILLWRGAPWIVLLLSGSIIEILIFSTAYFRILAGRHFLTDVLCGGLAGSWTAWIIISKHRARKT